MKKQNTWLYWVVGIMAIAAVGYFVYTRFAAPTNDDAATATGAGAGSESPNKKKPKGFFNAVTNELITDPNQIQILKDKMNAVRGNVK